LYDGPYPFIQTAEITEADLHVRRYAKTYSEFGLAQSRIWGKGTLCIVNAGENTGECAILGFRACFPDSVIAFVADPAKSDARFLKYYIDHIKPKLRTVTKGATQDNLSIEKLLSFPVLAPDVTGQRVVGSLLASYDSLIENSERRVQILEQMARSLYQEWFVRFRFPGHDRTEMVDSAAGRIPQGWSVGRLGEICALCRDKFKEIDHNSLPLVDLARMPQRTLAVRQTGVPRELSTSRIVFQENDILFGAIRPYLHKVVLAPWAGVTNVSVLVLRAESPILATVLAVVASMPETIRWANQHSTGTKMPVISWDVLAQMPVVMPAAPLLNAFHACIAPMLSLVKTLAVQNAYLRQTRDLLLPRLISGELDVSELDIKMPED